MKKREILTEKTIQEFNVTLYFNTFYIAHGSLRTDNEFDEAYAISDALAKVVEVYYLERKKASDGVNKGLAAQMLACSSQTRITAEPNAEDPLICDIAIYFKTSCNIPGIEAKDENEAMDKAKQYYDSEMKQNDKNSGLAAEILANSEIMRMSARGYLHLIPTENTYEI